MIELAQRERIVAIERGIDPSKLPPLPSLIDEDSYGPAAAARRARGRSQGLMIGGIIMVAIGISIMIVISTIEPEKKESIVGIVPAGIGLALLLSAYLVRPKNGNGGGASV
jgi:hypothetical protein